MKANASRNEIITLSIGGSILNPGAPDVDAIRKIASLINGFDSKFMITVGGGKAARAMVESARKLGINEFHSDRIAILQTRANAMLLRGCLDDAYPNIPETPEEAADAINGYRCVVSGGMIPGYTTDSVAVILAEACGSKRLVNVSNVDGIYDKDPKERGAKKYDRMSLSEFVDLAVKSDQRKAGTNFVFDSIAAKLAKRSGIELNMVSGDDLASVKNAILGKKHNGTVIS
jgi:uridylate kinase